MTEQNPPTGPIKTPRLNFKPTSPDGEHLLTDGDKENIENFVMGLAEIFGKMLNVAMEGEEPNQEHLDTIENMLEATASATEAQKKAFLEEKPSPRKVANIAYMEKREHEVIEQTRAVIRLLREDVSDEQYAGVLNALINNLRQDGVDQINEHIAAEHDKRAADSPTHDEEGCQFSQIDKRPRRVIYQRIYSPDPLIDNQLPGAPDVAMIIADLTALHVEVIATALHPSMIKVTEDRLDHQVEEAGVNSFIGEFFQRELRNDADPFARVFATARAEQDGIPTSGFRAVGFPLQVMVGAPDSSLLKRSIEEIIISPAAEFADINPEDFN